MKQELKLIRLEFVGNFIHFCLIMSNFQITESRNSSSLCDLCLLVFKVSIDDIYLLVTLVYKDFNSRFLTYLIRGERNLRWQKLVFALFK